MVGETMTAVLGFLLCAGLDPHCPLEYKGYLL